jgi:hypothetical protein
MMYEKKGEKEPDKDKDDGKGGPGVVEALANRPGVKKGVNLLGIVKKLAAKRAKAKNS